jgi:hypothetical protein
MFMKEMELIKKLVNDGLNNVEIGKIIGCDRNTVRRRMRKYGIERVLLKTHPNLNHDYFKEIDTKEKSYWLGFLSADGYIDNKRGRLSLDLAKKDLSHLEKFCDSIGANKNKIKNRIHKCGSESVSIRITSRKFISNLENNGCKNDKTFNLRLPNLSSRDLDLAFLFGLYDGDGFADSTVICGASIELLKDIKLKYNLNFEIKKKKRVYVLNLGAELKREMVSNYENSLKRKRKIFKGDKGIKTNNPEEYEKIKLSNLRSGSKLKFEVSKKELKKLIDENSYEKIGRMFGVSGNAIKKRAKKLGIKLKNRKKV